MAEFPFDLAMFVSFSNWAAWLRGFSREALQQNSFASVVMRYPPSFPQTLAVETLEIWLSQSRNAFLWQEKAYLRGNYKSIPKSS